MQTVSRLQNRVALWVALVGVAVFALAISSARATTIAQIDLATLAQGADAVVHAVVERTGTQMGYNASTAPWSVTELRVVQWISGGEGERILIRDPGAVWANGGRPLLGAAVYKPDEEVIVFLRRDAGGYFRTHNLAAGKLIVWREGKEAVVEQDLRQVSVVAAAEQSPVAEGDRGVIAQGQLSTLSTLREVLAELEALLRERQ